MARMSSARIPRTSTPSKRPLEVAISGCSMIGSAEVTPGVFLRRVGNLLPVRKLTVHALDHGVAVQADDLVEQLGAEAVHHAHHDDQSGDSKRDCADAEAGDDEDEPFALLRQQVPPGDHPLVAVDHAPTSLARADSMLSSELFPGRALLELDRAGGDPARTDDQLPRQSDQVHRGELRAAALVAVVVERLDSGADEMAVERLRGLAARLVVGAHGDEADAPRGDRLRPDDARFVMARLDDRGDEPRHSDAVASHQRGDLAGRRVPRP